MGKYRRDCICLLLSLSNNPGVGHEVYSTLPFTHFSTNLWSCIFYASGRGNVCNDKDPKDKNESKVISHTESGGAGKFGQENEHCCGWTHLWCK